MEALYILLGLLVLGVIGYILYKYNSKSQTFTVISPCNDLCFYAAGANGGCWFPISAQGGDTYNVCQHGMCLPCTKGGTCPSGYTTEPCF